MINFTEGKIKIKERDISVATSCDDLKSLSKEGLIEEQEGNGGRTFYYVEAVVDTMRFGAFIRLHQKKIEWLLLRWLDRPMKSWDDASEKGLNDEYRLLLNLVENKVGRPPDSKKNRQRMWRFKWGQIQVSYEPRSFEVAIFMVPR